MQTSKTWETLPPKDPNGNSKYNVLQAELNYSGEKARPIGKIGQDIGKYLEGNYKNLDCVTPQ